MFRSQLKDNADLIQHLKKKDVIRSARVEAAMMSVDRGMYSKTNPYMDAPQSIGHGVTISAPHMHAHALEILKDHLKPGARALDVGSGTGYLTACMAFMIGGSGQVVGIDRIPELVSRSIDVVKDVHPGLIESGRVKLVVGDGRLGYLVAAPYDAIHVGAAAAKVPQALIDQLKPGGRLMMPVGPEGQNQVLEHIDKLKDGTVSRTPLMGVIYGSLTGPDLEEPASSSSKSTSSGQTGRFHGTDNGELLRHLKSSNAIRSSRVESVMLSVDRGNYCKNDPYMNSPQGIGYGVTISAPCMHAHALEILKDHLKPGAKVLDIGSGTGYLTACMAYMVGENGRAVGIDHIPALVNRSIDVIKEVQPGLIESGRVKLVVGDGRFGYEAEAPYDAIHVGAAAPEIPQQLIDQLKPGGRLMMPVGPEHQNQELEQIDKMKDGTVSRTPLMGVIYGSLTDADSQWPSGGTWRP